MSESALTPLLEREPALRDADVAIVMEPTANAIHAGCLGNVNATWTFHGVSGHSARPVAGRQRHRARRAGDRRAGAGRAARARRVRRARVRRGRERRRDQGGIARNVIPDRVDRRRQLPLRPRALGAGRRGAPACAVRRRAPRARDRQQRAQRTRGRHAPVRAAPDRSRLARGRAQAGVDAGCGVRARRRRPPSTSAPATPRMPTAATSSSRVDALVRSYRTLEARAVRLSPTLEALRVYPFVRLTQAKNERLARGEQVVDFGIGEPREETPAFIRAALADAIEPMSTYPAAEGLPELREAIAAWAGAAVRRRAGPGHRGRADAGVQGGDLPPGPGRRPRDSVALPAPGYPVPERGALFAGREVVEAPLLAERGFLPDLDALPRRRARAAVAELPQQPDGGDRARSSSSSAPRRSPASTTSSWPPTRPTARSTSGPSRRSPRSRWPTARTSSRSTRSASARRCPATAAASRPATRRSSPR